MNYKFYFKNSPTNILSEGNTGQFDNFDIDGDFIESEAFAFLAIRSYLNLPISFPETTGVNKPCTGGVIVKN